jgi:hypothetical protein
LTPLLGKKLPDREAAGTLLGDGVAVGLGIGAAARQLVEEAGDLARPLAAHDEKAD